MRRVRLIVVVLVVLGLLAGAGFAGNATLRAHRLADQKADYTAGLDASRRADCARALPLLSSARTGGSATVRAGADRERQTCDDLIQAQKWAADQAPAAALSVWIRYLLSRPPAPYQASARTAAHALLTSYPLSTTVTTGLCWQRPTLAGDRILPNRDPLALKFLSACIAMLAKNNDEVTAMNMYGKLRTEFPAAATSPENIALLGRLVAKRLTLDGIKEGTKMTPTGHGSLHGRTRLTVTNNQRTTLLMVLAGDSTQLIKVAACTSCLARPDRAAALRQCERKGPERTVTLPAGQYVYAVVDDESFDQGVWAERWHLKPNAEYDYCWWDAP